ncbi:unnamed protein product [Mytilus coruscus]|uniref:Uncharacterized protein n=1 Tax=Mytilus coruscus TaxID=42192 RepID=A0A6J8CJN0_MYTCO|nr:unnamed protein product [Mytilus coruscus]
MSDLIGNYNHWYRICLAMSAFGFIALLASLACVGLRLFKFPENKVLRITAILVTFSAVVFILIGTVLFVKNVDDITTGGEFFYGGSIGTRATFNCTFTGRLGYCSETCERNLRNLDFGVITGDVCYYNNGSHYGQIIMCPASCCGTGKNPCCVESYTRLPYVVGAIVSVALLLVCLIVCCVYRAHTTAYTKPLLLPQENQEQQLCEYK